MGEALAAAYGPGCSLPAAERLRDRCTVVPIAAEAAGVEAAAVEAGAVEVGAAGSGRAVEGGAGAEEASGSGGVGRCLGGGLAVRMRAKNKAEENAAVSSSSGGARGAGGTARRSGTP